MYIVAFFIGFLFWKSCKFWRRLRALDYIWKSGVGFTLFYFTNLFVEILGKKGSGTMIFIVSWCYGGLTMVIFILFWQGSYPPLVAPHGDIKVSHGKLTSLDPSLGNPSKISGCFTNQWSFTLRKMKFHQQCPGFAKRCVSTVHCAMGPSLGVGRIL